MCFLAVCFIVRDILSWEYFLAQLKLLPYLKCCNNIISDIFEYIESCLISQENTKQHKFFIPDSVSPSKLIKSITKELKKTEVCVYKYVSMYVYISYMFQ